MTLRLAMISLFLASALVGAGQNVVPLLGSDSARIETARRSAAIEEQRGDWREESRHYDNIAFIYWEHNFFSEAVVWYNKSLQLNERLSNRAGISMINSNLGMLYADLKDYEKSLGHFQKTLDYRTMMKDKQGIITTGINMSVVLNNLKRYEESITRLQDALTLARELSDPDQMKSCYGMLSETYEKARQPDKAKYYFDLYRTFHEQVQKEKDQKSRKMVEETQLQLQLTEAEKRNQELELKLTANQLELKEKELITAGEARLTLYHDLSRTELQNELLKRDNELKNTQIVSEKNRNEKQRIRMVFLLVSLGFFTVLLVLILKAYFDKRKTSRLLAVQKAEIEQQRDAIGEAYSQLQELSEYKEGIRSMIVHDLKNPLNAILNPPNHYSDSLKLDTARKAGRQMLNLVMDILDVHKMEERHLKAEMEPTGLNGLVAGAVAEVEYLGQPRGLIFNQAIDLSFLVNCDQELVHRVLVNLLTNAVKFARQQSEITIAVEAAQPQGRVKISVSNLGDGISEDFLPRVFDKFSQREARNSGGVRSTGIGLTFCKLAVEAHGESIGVESVPGQITTFWFTLSGHQHDQMTFAGPTASHAEEPPMELAPSERALLQPVVIALGRLEIHQITKIRKVIKQLEGKRTENIDLWIERLYKAIETNNINTYRKLIEDHDHPNSDASQNTDC